jgi:hypothetical protein
MVLNGTSSTYDFHQDIARTASTSVVAESLIADIAERTDAEFRAVSAVRRFLANQAQSRRIRIVDMSVSRFADPEESSDELVVTQRVALPAADALSYWDDIGPEIARLTASVPPDEARIIAERVAINIEWEQDAV